VLQGVGEGREGVVLRGVAGREGVQRQVDGVGERAGCGAVQGAREDVGGGGIARGFARAAWSIGGSAHRVRGGSVRDRGGCGGALFIYQCKSDAELTALLLPLRPPGPAQDGLEDGRGQRFVFNGNLIIGKDTVKHFANISELERGISNLGLILRSKGGGGSFKCELYTPRPSWLHLGHELQSIERRIDRLLLC
jgi:hypothetical protein